MPLKIQRPIATLLVAAAAIVAGGCGSFDGATQRIAGAITPYRIDVVQGNFVSKEQVEALRPGMSRQQVRDTLGTPLVSSVFHADRWDYVFTMRKQGVETISKRLVVLFKGDAFERAEGDEMPSEQEFVATLDGRKKLGKVPALEASEDSLKRFDASRTTQAAKGNEPAGPTDGTAAVSAASAAPVTEYPPLEAPAK